MSDMQRMMQYNHNFHQIIYMKSKHSLCLNSDYSQKEIYLNFSRRRSLIKILNLHYLGQHYQTQIDYLIESQYYHHRLYWQIVNSVILHSSINYYWKLNFLYYLITLKHLIQNKTQSFLLILIMYFKPW